MGRANLTLYPVTGFMPALPSGLTEWLPSGIITAFFGLIWYEQKASEARLNRRMDELRQDQKELRQDMKDGLARLDVKMDRLLEARFTQPVTPER